ncbi:MAG: Ig-like domain-containing protein, partial [Coriobacteriia bacterium]|nr:Ig-like domain-containing protein [Coriobacteriia bacterium]
MQCAARLRAAAAGLLLPFLLVAPTTAFASGAVPVAGVDSYTTLEDSPLSIAAPGVLLNDTDPESDVLSAQLVHDAARGSVTLQASGAFIYHPAPDFFGTDTFSYRAFDGTGHSAVTTVSVTVTAVADAPIARFDRVLQWVDPVWATAPQAGARFGASIDVDGDWIVVGAPGEDTTGCAGAGAAYVYSRQGDSWVQEARLVAPDAAAGSGFGTAVTISRGRIVVGAPGSASGVLGGTGRAYAFTYSLTDLGWRFERALSPQFPAMGERFGSAVAVDDGVLAIAAPGAENGAGGHSGAVYTYVRGTWSWVDADAVIPPVAENNAVSVVSVSGDTLAVGVPVESVAGTDAAGGVYVYRLTGDAWSQEAHLVSDEPSTGDRFGAAVSVSGDALVVGAPLDDTATGVDAGSASGFSRVGGVWSPTAHLGPPASLPGVRFGTAVAIEGGAAMIGAPGARTAEHGAAGAAFMFASLNGVWQHQNRIEALDAAAGDRFGCAVAMSGDSLVVGAPDHDPVRSGDPVQAGGAFPFSGMPVPYAWQDTTFTVPASGVLRNDVHPDGLGMSVRLASPPALGTVTLAADGSFDYVPPSGVSGPVEFGYVASGGEASSAEALVGLYILPATSRPTAVSDEVTGTEDTTLVVPVGRLLTNDHVKTGLIGSTELVTGTTHGAIALESDGSFSYVPAPGYHGTDSFVYRVWDGVLAYSDPATVTITVAVNTAPVGVPDSFSTAEDTPLSVPLPGVLANDIDAEGHPLRAVMVAEPQHGTFSIAPDGSFDYTPEPDFNGVDSFVYHPVDAARLAGADTTVTITVTPVNDAPVAAPRAWSTISDTVLIVPAPGVLTSATDAEGDALTASVVTGCTHGSIDLSPDGGFTYQASPGFTGADIFTYRAYDGAAYSAPATVTITVSAPPARASSTYLRSSVSSVRRGHSVVLSGWVRPTTA